MYVPIFDSGCNLESRLDEACEALHVMELCTLKHRSSLPKKCSPTVSPTRLISQILLHTLFIPKGQYFLKVADITYTFAC